MKAEYHVKWMPIAEYDLFEIVDYIADQSIDQAVTVATKIREKAADLKCFAHRGRVVAELLELGVSDCRELVIPPWRIIYRASDKTVNVLAIFDARRNLEDVLFDRFKL
ncbi:MAG: type II toxin-antitoxin system RelE/ParE family toxin [Myxococcaceae bacterium]